MIDNKIYISEDGIYPIYEKAYLVGINPYCYRSGEPSEIIDVIIYTPKHNSPQRLCYKIKFFDGAIDYIPSTEVGHNYKIITFANLVSGEYASKFPQKTNQQQ